MSDLTREEKLQAWLVAEAEIRARLKPGTMSIADVATLSPLEFFDGIGQGELPAPPIGELMDFVPIEWSRDCFIFQGVPQMQHYNPIGSVHGGYAATLLDSAMGCAIHANLEKGQGYTTTDLRISYIRALTTKTGPVRAEGRIIHVGRSTALAEGRIYDVDGKLYATGSTTCLILGGK
ncbi:PaaI family thioesterase [Pseudomonas sp. BN415]|uniref:PaaI family thioesterase n=1 Tax=Pseudomonas sp. BN415 TaxID=2567889 RepID=UPI002453802C|nr:PaaI family thioesterase [Pseudomonas sp. BN415]MDH4582098.1 PaaI family thioesterase [Pseudomonas sp. BN415]